MTMKAERKKTPSCMLVYSDDRDPSREETAEVLDQLKPFPAEEVVPGTIRVKGSVQDVRKCLGDLAHWRLAQERIFRLNPPHKAQLR
ncbi:hypothetical protein ESD82_13630 [Paracoccus pantotrophus]|uniref:Uncharacterized protein n=2 Tax=Paracoccus pantotrophus TaxID=82367 RepID=A0A7H9BUH7_PARPN|nr:hypothetical protein [Paracoccus pantotrophus]QFG37214.1 hypothetical protein ESD82_13630 [Paracoccus pantotrophus]QLH14773.1 hypothetical protein HYQ43_10760 [Paracoccus pantotrophus]RDD99713.1 hypothetical protein DTW92_02920 [Paracoccus pantotrophus]RNI18234.1 hypothetical protein EB844_08030 [Paracoccus pantotrophus]